MKNEDKILKIRIMALNGVMLALILAFQMINLPNIITGIFVNAIFIFMTLYAGIGSSIILCIISPFIALITGHVLAPMYPVLPIIALGNIVFIVLYSKFKENKFWLRGIMPALAKAIVISGAGWLIIHCFAPELTTWLALPVLGVQFFTAVPGVWLGEKLKQKVK